MICRNNDIRCINQQYCSCYQDNMAEATVGAGGLLFSMIAGIFASFLYPAIKIWRSKSAYEKNETPKFMGSAWLFVSPVFGLLSNMLFQIVFAAGACAANVTQSYLVISIYKSVTFLIYALSMGLALIAFVIKNRRIIKLFVTEPKTRSIKKYFVSAGTGVIAILTALACSGVIFSVIDGYAANRLNSQTAAKNDERRLSSEISKLSLYTGKYKLTTRNDKTLFLITKNEDGTKLRLNMDSEEFTGDKSNPGCLLSPVIENDSIYFIVSECIVDKKPSPLSKVSFRIENNKIKMSFFYNVNSSGDTLEKLR